MARPRFHTPSIADLRELVNGPPSLRVSVYLPLPLRPSFDDLRAFPKSYERASNVAVARMRSLGVDGSKADETAARMEALEIDLSSLPRTARSVGVFVGPGGVEGFALDRELDQRLAIGRSLHLRPVLEAAAANRGYRLLALSTKHVALYEGDAEGLREVEGHRVPGSLEEALGTERTEGVLQMHSSTRSGEGIFHGHGGAKADREVDLERFHRVVSRAVRDFWHDRHDPCFLAADDSHRGRFFKLAGIPGLVEAGPSGSAERADAQEMHAEVWPMVQAHAREQAARSLGLARSALAHGGAAGELQSAVHAAASGRIARLFVEAGRHLPGHIDPESYGLVEPFGDEDALDELAALVLLRGGEVVVCADGELEPSGLLAELYHG